MPYSKVARISSNPVAHNLYKNCPAKYPTFSDALRRSWKSAKFNVWVAEQCQVLEVEKATGLNINDKFIINESGEGDVIDVSVSSRENLPSKISIYFFSLTGQKSSSIISSMVFLSSHEKILEQLYQQSICVATRENL